MTKEEILKKFDETVQNLFEDSYHHTINKIMKRLGLDYEDIRNFIGKDIVCMNPKHALNAMSGFEVLKFMTLVAAKTSCGETENEAERTIDSLVDAYNETKLPKLNDKVDMLLRLFGVNDEDDLDNLLTAVSDVKEAIQQAAEDIDKAAKEIERKPDCECKETGSECKCSKVSDYEKGGCDEKHEYRRHRRSPYSKYREMVGRRREHWADRRQKDGCNSKCDEKGIGEVKYFTSYYDSETMDEPSIKSKSIKFDPSKQSYSDVIKELRDQLALSDSEN